MVSAQRSALARLWRDRCTIYKRERVKDPETKLTGFEERVLLQDQPCKLSFETLSASAGDPAAAVAQSVKLFLSADVEIPAGCKIVVTRPGGLERQFIYAKSGEAGVFTSHQEILLEPWKGYA